MCFRQTAALGRGRRVAAKVLLVTLVTLVLIVAIGSSRATAIADRGAATAPLPASCRLVRDIRAFVDRETVVVPRGTRLAPRPWNSRFAHATVDGRDTVIARALIATACAVETVSSSSAAASPASRAAAMPARTSAGPPCRPAAERILARSRVAATKDSRATTDALESAAAAARVVDAHCVEAHAWLARAALARGDVAAATRVWDELWSAWADDVQPSGGARAIALGAAVRGRLDALRAAPLLDTTDSTTMAAVTAVRGSSRVGPVVVEEPVGGTFSIAAVGDIHLGRGWPSDRAALIPGDGVGYFDDVRAPLLAASLSVGNLETALADRGDSHKCSPRARSAGICFSFRAPTTLAPRLGEAGFDALSLANNHAADFGMTGLVTTERALAGAGIQGVGVGSRAATRTIEGMRVAITAFSTGHLDLGLDDLEAVRREVARLDRAHDVVVILFHGGAEGPAHAHVPWARERYLGEDRGDVVAFAHAAVDAGADVVLGSGPHVLRGIERYRGRLIAYSLGNFSSWQTFPTEGPAADSGVLRVEVAQNGVAVAASFTSTTMDRSGRPRIDETGAGLKMVRRLSFEDFGDALLDAEGRWSRDASSRRVAAVVAEASRAAARAPASDSPRAPRTRAERPRPKDRIGSCTLVAATTLWRDGSFITAAEGTQLTLGQRGPAFTTVEVISGEQRAPAQLANALVTRCRRPVPLTDEDGGR